MKCVKCQKELDNCTAYTSADTSLIEPGDAMCYEHYTTLVRRKNKAERKEKQANDNNRTLKIRLCSWV
jgi:hypothetical protein